MEVMMVPLLDNKGDLCHIRDTGSDLVINSLRRQYKNEIQLIVLLGFIETLEKIGLM